MIIFKAISIIGIVINEPKEWDYLGKKGISYTACVAVIGPRANVAAITIKAKNSDELKKKISLYTVGKPAEIEITDIVPVFKTGEKRAASYEMCA